MAASGERGFRGFILSVGDELISGITLDTNSAWLSQKLAECGARVVGHATVGDDQAAIEEAIKRAAVKADLLVVTGGIGPTPDDLTREALAGVLNVPLVEFAPWMRQMEAFFEKRGRVMQPGNRKQALIPAGGKIIWNPIGTAAGIDADHLPWDRLSEQADRAYCKIVVLPGVPAEMKAMFEQHVAPWTREQARLRGGRVLRMRALHTFGLGESDIAARLGELLRRREDLEDLQVGTTASGGVVSVRIYAGGADEAGAGTKLEAVEREVRDKLGDVVYGSDEETLAEVVGRLLRQHPSRPVLRTAESCTGGLVAKLVTDVAGCSDYFDRGFVTYANEAKTDVLGVPPELIAAHGAVSEEVAAAMAEGALRAPAAAGGDRPAVAVSITGIAGPGGGSEAKPVGTVCIGLASTLRGEVVFTRRFFFPGDREMIRGRSALMALALLRFHLLGRDLADLPF